ncbi:CAZyme family [Penicillium bovifimosum]|uniref:alpha-galactosidase n=1 Tax=Penicillium bovifimosum TaxID=126998 RepID=A0A9W9GST0_9EURO|nr:CAZyme family [Penicillium bovifimosum]KAJ5129450.1 CAZyme family [Penicillium bovifimosum]
MMTSPRNFSWQVLAAYKSLLACGALLFFLAIGMDLRAELGAGTNEKKILKRDSTSTGDAAIWQPTAGVKWQIQLVDTVEDTSVDADIWDIDLFENTAETITTLQGKGHKVICYFSAGTYEDWRSDKDKFNSADLGSDLDEWAGEKWLNIKSDGVRSVMQSRLDMAKEKGCDGVDPDNIDAYGNENGLGLTEADSIAYLSFLADESHSRGMSIGLKNGGDIIGSVIDKMQWSVNEQCAEYNECDVYAAFTEVNKPVFHIEYSDVTIDAVNSGSGDADADKDDTETGTGSDATTAGTGSDVDEASSIEGGASTNAEDGDDEEDEEDDDDNDDEDNEDNDARPHRNGKQRHRHTHRHDYRKLRARAVLSSALKNSACNAANSDKFSTVIKNMNLDAWVEYC